RSGAAVGDVEIRHHAQVEGTCRDPHPGRFRRVGPHSAATARAHACRRDSPGSVCRTCRGCSWCADLQSGADQRSTAETPLQITPWWRRPPLLSMRLSSEPLFNVRSLWSRLCLESEPQVRTATVGGGSKE